MTSNEAKTSGETNGNKRIIFFLSFLRKWDHRMWHHFGKQPNQSLFEMTETTCRGASGGFGQGNSPKQNTKPPIQQNSVLACEYTTWETNSQRKWRQWRRRRISQCREAAVPEQRTGWSGGRARAGVVWGVSWAELSWAELRAGCIEERRSVTRGRGWGGCLPARPPPRSASRSSACPCPENKHSVSL